MAGCMNDPNVSGTGLPVTDKLVVICEAANEAGPGMASEVATLVLGWKMLDCTHHGRAL